jgi:hypothetical protein
VETRETNYVQVVKAGFSRMLYDHERWNYTVITHAEVVAIVDQAA